MASSATSNATSTGSFAINVSIKDGGGSISMDGFRRHITAIISADSISATKPSTMAKRNDRLQGKVMLAASVTLEKAKEYARQLHQSKYEDEPIHAQLDPSWKQPQQAKAKTAASRNTETTAQEAAVATEETKEEEEYDGKAVWNNGKLVAEKFFDWLHQGNFGAVVGRKKNKKNNDNDKIDLSMVERDIVHQLFDAFVKQLPGTPAKKKQFSKEQRRMEGLVMAALRSQKLLRTKRYSDGVVLCSFALADKTSFAPVQERQTAREQILQQTKDQMADKGGVVVAEQAVTSPSGPVLPINQKVSVDFDIQLSQDAEKPMKLKKIQIGGQHKSRFQVVPKMPLNINNDTTAVRLSFRAIGTGVSRARITFLFQNAKGKQFTILRSLLLRSGDADMYDVLKPKTPYVKKEKRFDKPIKEENVMGPPKQQQGGAEGAAAAVGYSDLKQFKVPLDVRELVELKEMDAALVPPSYTTPEEDLSAVYSTFWQNLLWTTELQAYEDIKLFDMEDASLQNAGRFFKLYVAGLAEGRPSVLRGDLVKCTWKGKEYRGRVVAVELLDVLLEFHPAFHKNFKVNLDRVELVRFTFSRTAFRTAHAGTIRAPEEMGPAMLLPQPSHMTQIQDNNSESTGRFCPKNLKWTSSNLNDQQKQAVQQIIEGKLRPMPNIIFGPPGTGKTTTMVEAVFQLANLHKHDRKKQQSKLNILLVAPSNDAADILVEKLSSYFPPSEMIRVLAYTRPIDTVPDLVRPYCREGLEPKQLGPEIMAVQIVVATVNMASRLWCTPGGGGVDKGYFDVLCVDEAGHATEPEVIAVAATMMKFNAEKPGQLVLAGDPMQLGPIITSDLCKKFGMEQSYMERLIKTSPAYALDDQDRYPADLVTLLVNNYRSHPDILKLPNEMFYRNQLVPCGDKFTTHSMAKWEHLPKKGFPVLFHAVDGENTREGNSPSWFNPEEALVVVDYVKNLVKHSKPPIREDEIGIITPYARQVQKIRIALKVSDVGDVKVGSVETFQGQERRVIIISTVRSENAMLSHDLKYNLGFVANEKRFNVAVTRAKALLIVVGNPRVLASDTKNWLPLLRFCRDNGSWSGEEWTEGAMSSDSDDDEEEDESASDKEEDWEVVKDQETRGYINREE